LPDASEFAGTEAVALRFGSLKRAFAVIRRITDAARPPHPCPSPPPYRRQDGNDCAPAGGEGFWESIARRRREDILVYLALARFRKRPALGQLPRTLQRDMKAFFGAYKRACAEADLLLFQAGDPAAIDEACKRSTIGKLLPDDLYVHRSALDSLAPVLRIYEGCGRAYLGEVDGANIIKIHRRSGKLSYLVYPDFDSDPHPALLRCVKLNLRTRQIEWSATH
jgi:DNA phosphorothioation-associated putative methyltransferase